MNWSQPVDLYCERTDPAFWAEPVNAVSNAAFLLAAIAAFVLWRRAGDRDWPVAILIALTAAIGTGSFIFHTVATRGAWFFDSVPIAIFIHAYLFFALRRFLGVRLMMALILLAGFAVLSSVVKASIPREALNGSHGYLPALAATLLIGWLARAQKSGQLLLVAGGVLAVSIFFRTIDNAVCAQFPLGTHFLWHTLNGVVLYLLLYAAVAGRNHGPP